MFDNITDIYYLVTGVIATAATTVGIVYKLASWIKTSVEKSNRELQETLKKENEEIRKQVKEENTKIKEDTMNHINENRKDINNVQQNLSRELKYSSEIVSGKLDNISTDLNESKTKVERFSNEMNRTVSKNREYLNNHETRITVVENKILNGDLSNYNKQTNRFKSMGNNKEDE